MRKRLRATPIWAATRRIARGAASRSTSSPPNGATTQSSPPLGRHSTRSRSRSSTASAFRPVSRTRCGSRGAGSSRRPATCSSCSRTRWGAPTASALSVARSCAVASLALHDDDAARRFSRQAISTSARPERNLAAHELRYHRLARALASAAGEIVGDVVRGRRAAAARFLHGDSEVAALAGLGRDVPWQSASKSIRGYARYVELARADFERRPAAGPLTSTEVDVLKLLDSGRNAPQIAALLDRSPHTIRTHLRNASAKLETHGRAETLTRARHLGLLADAATTRLGGAST